MYANLKERFVDWMMPGDECELKYPREDYTRALGVVFDGVTIVVAIVGICVMRAA